MTTEITNLQNYIDSLIKKYESQIQACADEVRKLTSQGSEQQARYYMGLEKAYQNIYNDLTGKNYAPNIYK
jgi:hypothetical protein